MVTIIVVLVVFSVVVYTIVNLCTVYQIKCSSIGFCQRVCLVSSHLKFASALVQILVVKQIILGQKRTAEASQIIITSCKVVII